MNDVKSSSKVWTWVAIGCGGLAVLALMLGCLGMLFLGGWTTTASPTPAPPSPPAPTTPR